MCIISIASEVMKLIFAVLNMSFNGGHYTVIIKQQFLYINTQLKVGQDGIGDRRAYKLEVSQSVID